MALPASLPKWLGWALPGGAPSTSVVRAEAAVSAVAMQAAPALEMSFDARLSAVSVRDATSSCDSACPSEGVGGGNKEGEREMGRVGVCNETTIFVGWCEAGGPHA